MINPGPLAGRTIALPETRELDRLARILEDDGARTVRCPLVAIQDAPDSAPVDAWVIELVRRGFDDVIFLTGEGVTRLLARAEALGCRAEAVAALGRARKITRGPKPARALHAVGLGADLPARVPTSQGVIEALAADDLRGHRVGVQLYGSDPNEPLVRALAGQGATVRTVAPYVYAAAGDEEAVVALVAQMERGDVDAIAFTSASQVERLFAVARARGLDASLRGALARTMVAAIGPVARAALEERAITPRIVPDPPFVMKRLTAAITLALTRER